MLMNVAGGITFFWKNCR